MANWAITNYTIEGNIESLEKINDAILNHSVEYKSSDNWEGNILDALGIDFREKLPDGKDKFYIRGFIMDNPSFDKANGILSFYAEEAWRQTDFHILLEQKFKDIKVYFCCEEPDCDVFVTNDKKGKYYPERYLVDCCINNDYKHEYFKTKKDTYAFIKNISMCKNEKDVEEFNEVNSSLGLNDFINVYKYSIIE